MSEDRKKTVKHKSIRTQKIYAKRKIVSVSDDKLDKSLLDLPSDFSS